MNMARKHVGTNKPNTRPEAIQPLYGNPVEPLAKGRLGSIAVPRGRLLSIVSASAFDLLTKPTGASMISHFRGLT
jgi:hypothetical protein